MRYQHGQYAAYTVDRCRCTPCTKAAGAYNAERRRRLILGTWTGGTVNPRRVRDHLIKLRDTGMTLTAIAEQSGVTTWTLTCILNGRRCKLINARKLMAVEPTRTPMGLVPSTGTLRRIQSLYWLGWPASSIADTAGLPVGTITGVLKDADKRTKVRGTTANGVETAYRKLLTKTPPPGSHSTAARRRAIDSAWAPPLAWDDIENPNEIPKGLGGHYDARWQNLHHDVEELARQGVNRDQIAARLGRKWHSIQDTYRRNNTPLPPELRSTA